MILSSGARLGSYEVLAPIGKGGMGEVWKAHDTKLGRDVALKILPAAFASDLDRMARFEREARVLASLDHPNIAAIYGLEESDGVRALVLALIDGPTLADRIAAGPIPLDEAIQIARQIADAVEYAHDRGVIHRDLKPANIKITSGGMVKVLDFGLAKALDDEPVAASGTNSPTLTMNATRAGVLLGTAAYMSPEQAKGKQADRRSDIWSFGAVLYEMLIGKPPFSGESVGEVIAAVIKDEPRRDAVPAELRGLVARCLNKDPRQRLQAIGEARIALENPPAPQHIESVTAKIKRPLGWIVAVVLALIAAGFGSSWWRATRHMEQPLTRFSVDLGPDAVAGNRATIAISPDGRRIVFPVKTGLATRLLDQPQGSTISGTEGAADPFFSPDGQWIAFFAGGKLKKVSVQGGAVVTVCDIQTEDRGAVWGEDGTIILTLGGGPGLGLSRVPAAGGTPQTLTKPAERGEATDRWPQILPGGDLVLFTASPRVGAGYDDANVEILSLKTGQIRVIQRGGYFGRYVPGGYLLYVHQDTLFGAKFDPKRQEVTGTPVPLLEDVEANSGAGSGQFDFSPNGTFAYLGGKSAGRIGRTISWLDGSGKTQALMSAPAAYNTIRLSPNGKLLAFSLGDIQVYDWARDTLRRLTFSGQEGRFPVWTPDGKHLVYRSQNKEGMVSIQWIRSDGAGESQTLLTSKEELWPYSFSPDGKRLAFNQLTANTSLDIWTLPLDTSDADHPKPGKPEAFLHTPVTEQDPAFSPDGRWIAYGSFESGREEIYVRPFPGPGGKWQISNGGGEYPIWSRNGRELFYETAIPDNHIMVAGYSARADSFEAEKPRLWANTQLLGMFPYWNLDLAPDGKRFAIIPAPQFGGGQQGNVHINFLLNFFDELRRRVPVNK